MLTTISNFPSLLRPGNAAVFEDYNIYPQWWFPVYARKKSDKAVEYELQMQSLGLAQLKSESGSIAMSSFQERYKTAYVMQYYGIGFKITRSAIKDNLYHSEFGMNNQAMRNSLDTLKNMNAAAPFNLAFTSFTTADGKPLASTTHPTAIGVNATTFDVNVDFSEASVEAAITAIKGWTNQAGLPINMMPQRVLVPQALAFQATRIFRSEFTPGSPNNAVNALVYDKYLPHGPLVSQFLTNPKAWFILTDEPNGFKYYMREPLEIDFIQDPTVMSVTTVALERYAFGCSDPLAVFGVKGA